MVTYSESHNIENLQYESDIAFSYKAVLIQDKCLTNFLQTFVSLFDLGGPGGCPCRTYHGGPKTEATEANHRNTVSSPEDLYQGMLAWLEAGVLSNLVFTLPKFGIIFFFLCSHISFSCSFYLSIYISIYLPVFLHLYLSLSLSVSLSVSLSLTLPYTPSLF